VVEATALEWRGRWYERAQWRTLHLMGFLIRSRVFPRWIRFGIRRLLGEGHPLQRYVPWLASEVHRNDAAAIVQAGQALSRYDAREWAGHLGVPAASLITTKDRLVWPRKQRALADALGAYVVEIADDHLCSWTSNEDFAKATLTLVQHVLA
jgi:3-oxoadipate enol-lactonase